MDNQKYIAIPGGWGSDQSIMGKTISHEVLMGKKGEFESGCLWNFPSHMLKIRFLNVQNSHSAWATDAPNFHSIWVNRLHLSVFKFLSILDFFYIHISSRSTSYNQNQPRQNCVHHGLPVYNFLQSWTILSLWFIQSLLHQVLGAVYPGIKLPGHEADHSSSI